VPVIVLLVGALLTALLSWAAATANSGNEHRLLKLDVQQAASVLTSALTGIQLPLTAAFDIAHATSDPSTFEKFIATDVGPNKQFLSASLWQISPGPPKPLVLVGATPAIETDGRAATFFAGLRPSALLSVSGVLGGANPRLGFAVLPPGVGAITAVYAEIGLPSHKKAATPNNSAFSDLNFALYLGRTTAASSLLETTGLQTGYKATATVPFGDSAITLVGTARTTLAGGLSSTLPWVVALVGAALAITGAVTAEYLVRRRRLAEALAAENATLYLEQRTISETLQHSLLPAEIPTVAGLQVAVRYVPGVGGIDVGGDWYDVMETGDGSSMFVIGDVAGRGLTAATTMAYLRHVMRAYVAEGDGPAMVLTKLGDLVGQASDGHFATVLCIQVDVTRHHLTVASAGHFPPLVIDQDGARYVDLTVATPIGVGRRNVPQETSIVVGTSASLLAFTDGLVERRGENLDVGLERLRQAAPGRAGDVDALLGGLLADLTPDGSDDDIAILGVQWTE
jgi:serine phosphatase RsbU (regulator of sigma subunit)